MREKSKVKGIQYVIDAEGRRTAVLIDLEQYEALWEDFYDALMAEARKDEPRIAWSDAKAKKDVNA